MFLHSYMVAVEKLLSRMVRPFTTENKWIGWWYEAALKNRSVFVDLRYTE